MTAESSVQPLGSFSQETPWWFSVVVHAFQRQGRWISEPAMTKKTGIQCSHIVHMAATVDTFCLYVVWFLIIVFCHQV